MEKGEEMFQAGGINRGRRVSGEFRSYKIQQIGGLSGGVLGDC